MNYIFFTLCLILISCEIINPEEDIISNIYIENIRLETDTDLGTNSSNITDAWLYIDDEFLGVYPLPALIPVLKNGPQDIIIEAGIKKNGITASRISYPYFNRYTTNKDLLPNQTCSISPFVNYKLNEFPYQENFEGNGTILNVLTDTINHSIEKIYSNISDPILGNTYGKIVISGEENEIFECRTNSYPIPTDKQVYLELDYKASSTFVIGLYATNSQTTEKTAIIYLNKKDEWNKIYISLAETINSFGNGYNNFNIFIGMSRNTDQDINELLLDNIRIVYEQ
jgi:hypothetical protein